MRIVIDMQGAQNAGRFCEIGQYTMDISEAIARNRGEHEVILALNGSMPEAIMDIRNKFSDIIPQENIRVWYSPKSTVELIHESFISSLRPDIVLENSLTPIEEVIEKLQNLHQHQKNNELESGKKLRLAYVSPLPPLKTGIADYSAEVLPALAAFYDISVVVDQEEISDSWIVKNCKVVSIKEFKKDSANYDRIIYQFGNSPFHKHMFETIRDIPGIVVLHDFFLSNQVKRMTHQDEGNWLQELYNSHGYSSGIYYRNSEDKTDVIFKYPVNLAAIDNSLGVIVHSQEPIRLFTQWYEGPAYDWYVIPQIHDSLQRYSRDEARELLNVSDDTFLVCTFGILGPIKLNHRLLHAWCESLLGKKPKCKLVFVGENNDGDYGAEMLSEINRVTGEKVLITGWTSDEVYQQYLAASDICVQLRTMSRGETSRTVLDTMNYGKPTIVNANGSMADLDEGSVKILPDDFSDEDLIDALERLYNDEPLRNKIGNTARQTILDFHSPTICASQYYEAIEKSYLHAVGNTSSLVNKIVVNSDGRLDQSIMRNIATTIAKSFPPKYRLRQLFVDISPLHITDLKTGIERVTRSILLEWLYNPPKGFRVEPVFASSGGTYHYARNFTMNLLEIDTDKKIQEFPIDYYPGDVFVGLNLNGRGVIANKNLFEEMRRVGVSVHFLIYDLLPILKEKYFPPSMKDTHEKWLDIVVKNDSAICISKSVANELRQWNKDRCADNYSQFRIEWFHIGADIESSAPSKGLPYDSDKIIDNIKSHISFLMVGTVEPRKGHSQVLDAMEALWDRSVDAILVIVGKSGWQVEEVTQRIISHREYGKRLIWLEGISDEYLDLVYDAATVLIMASEGEGFGLPLIEAAQHGIPIIARNIPVFREVAGEHAYYFRAYDGTGLANEVETWIGLYNKKEIPSSINMHYLTWEQSAKQLLEKIM